MTVATMKTNRVSNASRNRRNIRNAPSAYLSRKNGDANVRKYLNAALSDNSLLAYRADLKHFLAWAALDHHRSESQRDHFVVARRLQIPQAVHGNMPAIHIIADVLSFDK